jgi:hypothetical protein
MERKLLVNHDSMYNIKICSFLYHGQDIYRT